MTNTDKPAARFGLSRDMQALPEHPSAKILELAAKRGNCIYLAQGNGSDPTPEFIQKAMHKAMEDGYTFYTPSPGLKPLREEIRAYYKRIYNFDMPLGRILVTPAASSANFLAQMSVLNPDDEIIIIAPVWQNLVGAAHLRSAVPVEVLLDQGQGGNWYLDLEKIYAAVTPKTRAILVNSPNNPTSWVMPEDQVKTLMNFCRQKNIWVIADEVYNRIVYEGKYAPSFVHHAGHNDKLLILNSFSKTWAMTGARLGWLIIPEELESTYYDLARYVHFCPASFVQHGGIAALRDGEEFIKKEVARFKRNADRTTAFLAQYPEIGFSKPIASFYAFFRLPDGMESGKFAEDLVTQQGLVLNPGLSFGDDSKGYMRMCIAVNEPVMEDALGRLGRFFDDLGIKKS